MSFNKRKRRTSPSPIKPVVESVLKKGARRAGKIASLTMAEVKGLLGLVKL